jgi:predicted RNase H-like nuclease (RuvC/YqgF family)
MSEKRFVSEYVEIIDENGSRQAVCVTDNEHTVSFEVKDEYVAMDLCQKLNGLSDTVEALILDRNKQEEKLDIARRNMTKQLEKIDEQQATINKLKEENEQLRRLFEEMKQPITINLTEEDEKELRKLLGLIEDE